MIFFLDLNVKIKVNKYIFVIVNISNYFEQFQKDCVSPYSVKGYRVKILSQQSDNGARVASINNLLDVDGERVDLVGGEYEVRYVIVLGHIYMLYISLFSRRNINRLTSFIPLLFLFLVFFFFFNILFIQLFTV